MEDVRRTCSTYEIADRLGVDAKTIRNYVKRGLITPVNTVKSVAGNFAYRFDEDVADNFVNGCFIGGRSGELIFTISHAASYVGIGVSTLEKCIADGQITPDVVLPRGKNGQASWRRFTRSNLDDFIHRYWIGRRRRERRKRS